MKFEATFTDTFGGEVNFGWVRRAEFDAPDTASDALLIRRAKRALGVVGRHKWHCKGERADIVGECTCILIDEKRDLMEDAGDWSFLNTPDSSVQWPNHDGIGPLYIGRVSLPIL